MQFWKDGSKGVGDFILGEEITEKSLNLDLYLLQNYET